MSKTIEVPFEVIKVGIRQSVVLKRWYKKYLRDNKPPVEIEPEETEEVTSEEETAEEDVEETEKVDFRELKRNDLVKYAASLGIERSNTKSNEDLYKEIESLNSGDKDADNNNSSG